MKIFNKIIAILLCCLVLGCAKTKEDKLANLTPEQLYSDGMVYLKKGSYAESIKYFERIGQEYPYSTIAGEAQLMECYAYYKLSKFEYAIAGLNDYISLYPGEKSIEYAYYLKAICYYDQIVTIKLDQQITEKAKDALTDLINRFPDSEYSRDARFKINLVLDHLAGKEMEIGRFYLQKGDVIAAINRFKVVVDQYQTTTHIEEALYRLSMCYYSLGVKVQAKRYAAVLGDNYPDSKWYEYNYEFLMEENASVSQDK
ncbi:MAG: outer membrane protein assembly factor BamD [Rickettsiales bacterium]|jgi:outer membrane protein assembly factor BamD|nr:outer membrane protein assembly factor BamD [Rickettsiales bacterium]